jgi:serine/threonine protein kinase
LLDIANALTTLHENGIIHRDVKPANILLDGTRAILGDFGVVRSADFPEQTTTGAFLGTIRYAAPEYLFGEEYDASIDTYSFGCVAYYAYMNHEPRGADSHWARLVARSYDEAGNGGLARDVYELALRRRIGARQAQFVRAVLAHTACARHSRHLSLKGFAKAVEAQLWCQSFVLDCDEFTAGSSVFEDRFGTSIDGVETLVASLEPAERERLLSLLEDFYQKGFVPEPPDDTVMQHLLQLGVLRKEWLDHPTYHLDTLQALPRQYGKLTLWACSNRRSHRQPNGLGVTALV